MSNKLRLIKDRFVETMIEVAKNTDKKILDITREEYVRYTVDNDIEGRLNKVELNLIGGFKKAKENYITHISKDIGKPRILLIDIETAPMVVYTWSLWDQNVGLNQIIEDWSILSFAAKWLDDSDDKIMYFDTTNMEDLKDDSELLVELHKLLDEADIVCGQNSKSFDTKKINARLALAGMNPPSPYRQYDTKIIAKRHFKFTSNRLAYMTDKLCTKYKKLDHGKFAGFSLWKEYLAGNKEAQKEMREYNEYDVLSLQELFLKLLPWDDSINFNAYLECDYDVCTCGSIDFKKKGFHYTNTQKYQRYECKNCGKSMRSRKAEKNKKKVTKSTNTAR